MITVIVVHSDLPPSPAPWRYWSLNWQSELLFYNSITPLELEMKPEVLPAVKDSLG